MGKTGEPIVDESFPDHFLGELTTQLQTLAQTSGRCKNAITVDALREYLNIEAWQIQDIERGIEEADRGEFASSEEVNALFRKYGCSVD